ncbi:hypothetical protein Mag101_11385 [Microbulbifer agarilyticus]|uniref:BD-FAE-like domain-containing protein n=1 Tax=Microbulbifer agarilyticus TaxID=260552 RepID=A0A1Q2M7H1_9GAMM|nr:alpha/beta hydrolase [Microbulbifer agarilyticus]AQQ68172.1 hypothetical protein Mag101_11385 [Microbulbifer agarilyticus]
MEKPDLRLMNPSLRRVIAGVLASFYPLSLTAGTESVFADWPVEARNKVGSAYPDVLKSSSLVEEAFLWPQDAEVLQDGIALISLDSFAKSNPHLVITHPSLLVYPAKQAKSKRPAVIVLPGGGYKGVAIGSRSTLGANGEAVCAWLNNAGATCIVLKYRVPNSGCSWNALAKRHDTPAVPMALQDAQRAVSYLRRNASKYAIDPNRIGVMGFSAGGNLAVLASTAFKRRAYSLIDQADLVSSRPDFVVAVYPGHMTMEHKNKKPKALAAQELNSDIVISADIPPTLLVHAKDDSVNPVHYSQVYKRELAQAGVKVDLLLYESGGHGFGVKPQGEDSDQWREDALRWLTEMKFL